MRHLFLIILGMLATAAWAQTAADSLWVRPFGAEGECEAAVVRQTADHGFILAGEEHAAAGDEVRVVRTDSTGHLLWSRSFCDRRSLKARDVRQMSDGDILIAGTASTLAADSERAFALRINEQGDMLWLRTYGDTTCGFHALQPAFNGGCVLAGWERATDAGGTDLTLTSMDAFGTFLWHRRFEQTGDEWAAALQKTSDGGWIVAGQQIGEANRQAVQLLCTDANGVQKWQKIIPQKGQLRVFDLDHTHDNGFVIAGWRNPPGLDPCLFFLLNVDGNGNPVWLRSFRTEFENRTANVMLRTVPSGFLMVKHKVSLGSGPREMQLYKMDEDGELHYRHSYSAAGHVEYELFTHYTVSERAAPFAAAIEDFFVNSYPRITEKISIHPAAPFPERSERHQPLDSFGNIYLATFALNHRQQVKITVHDTMGRLRSTVANYEYGAGEYGETFDGWALPAGIYFLRVETEDLLTVQKVVLVR